ncbi:uncharacterized protein G2W53_016207 [Senna tora]|uniref:SWIM-type domain-containing protein n=1 Tax=Senna tora TaxID=362788 RepID=A0A834TMD1_9FABA|nr:uncharacterized protein G2W53_016207 [Senna tora]
MGIFEQASRTLWSRTGFSHFSKSDALLNNYCEQLNFELVKKRAKPIITMDEELRLYIAIKMNKERKKATAYDGSITPQAKKNLEEAKINSGRWTPYWVGDPEGNKYEVECRPIKMVVDLGISSCTCNMWGLTGIPCEHAVACMAYKNVDPEDIVHPFFSIQLWRKTYEPYARPINLSEFWQKIGLPDIEPPPFKRPARRPKKQRRKGNDPPPKPKPHMAKRKTYKCSKYGGTKHNSRTCKGPPPTPNNQSVETSTVLPTPPPNSKDLSQSSQSTIGMAPTIPTSQNPSTSTMVFMPTSTVSLALPITQPMATTTAMRASTSRPQLPITQPMIPTIAVRPPPLKPPSMH